MPSYEEESSSTFLTVSALAVVSGVVNLVIIGLAVVVVLQLWRRRAVKEPEKKGEDNSAYASLSDVTRVNLGHDATYDVIKKAPDAQF